MQVFLLTPCLINKDNACLDDYPQGGFDELLAYIAALPPAPGCDAGETVL